MLTLTKRNLLLTVPGFGLLAATPAAQAGSLSVLNERRPDAQAANSNPRVAE
jgi:hypothetical protein